MLHRRPCRVIYVNEADNEQLNKNTFIKPADTLWHKTPAREKPPQNSRSEKAVRGGMLVGLWRTGKMFNAGYCEEL